MLLFSGGITIGTQKVYNSANKLFTLSKYQPVGIMVYDSADLMAIPWELIIKEYRDHLGEVVFDTLTEYAHHFWDFLAANRHIIPDSTRDEYRYYLVNAFLSYVYGQLESKVEITLKESGEVSIDSTVEILNSILTESESYLGTVPYVEGANEKTAEEILASFGSSLETLVGGKFGELFTSLEEPTRLKIYALVGEACVRSHYPLNTSGVVIAGYGRLDMFPKLASYQVEGIVGSLIRKSINLGKSTVQNTDFRTTIVPFAQDEMVWTFLRGTDPDIEKFASRYLDDVFNNYAISLDSDDLGIIKEQLIKIQQRISTDSVDLLKTFTDDFYQFQQRNNIQPILDMVGVLPKDELAAMAESLVNLTVFKRKISKTVETVGGPIDVAVISKGDGFIWVKRKHYFRPELNPHFFENYYRGR